jgi:hypothetical protein
MKDKKKISFKLRKNDLRLKYYNSHFSDHPIIHYLYNNKLIISLNVELHLQTLKKIKLCDLSKNQIIDYKNKKILNAIQKLINKFPYVKIVDLHLQECYPSLYYLIATQLTFLKKLSKPTNLISQNIFEGRDILSDNPKIVYGGGTFNHTSFCSFKFESDNNYEFDLPLFVFDKEDREEDYHYKMSVYYQQNKDKFMKAIPVFQEINRNPFDNEFLGKDYLYATCRGLYIPELSGINIHLERESLIYIIDEIKDGTLFKFWLNYNSQKYLDYTKDSYKKYFKKKLEYDYAEEIGKKVYLAGDLNIIDKKSHIIIDNLPNCKIVKNEYLDWIIIDVTIGDQEKKNENLFL